MNIIRRVSGASIVMFLGAFLVAQSSCATLQSLWDSGPASEEYELMAEETRREAEVLAASGDLEGAGAALDTVADLMDAAADAKGGDISGFVNLAVNFIPPPYNTLATSVAGLAALWWGRGHQKMGREVVRSFPKEGQAALTDAQRESLSKNTTHRSRKIISKTKSKDRKKAAKALAKASVAEVE